METNTKKKQVRIGRYLHEVITIKDSAGTILSHMLKPVMFEFYPRDFVQTIVGATLLSIPVAFTEEVWKLGSELPLWNIVGISCVSIIFLGTFIYYNYYRDILHTQYVNFFKRVIFTYLISISIAVLVLFLINKTDFTADTITTIKRVVILAFPASMSAAVADMVK